ncbi:MAG: VOC family protein [Halobaculum sp.]
MTDGDGGRLLGFNHVALEVGDLDAALDWYGTLFTFTVRGETESAVFVDAGDQFLALGESDSETIDEKRHVGLVVDDLDAVERRLDAVDAERLQTDGFDIRDPWGNRLQLVAYEDVQFTKADHVLDGMGVDQSTVAKTDSALRELAEKGMAPASHEE